MTPEQYQKLVSAGMSAEQIGIVMQMLADDARTLKEAEEARKAQGRERVQKWRDSRKQKAVTLQKRNGNATLPLTGAAARGEDNLLTSNQAEQEERKKEREDDGEFADFWSLFPNKVGKRAAEREFVLARKRASFEAIMAGLRRYVAKTDDRAWCNPSTFLHQDRWEDQPAAQSVQHRSGAPPPAHPGQGYNDVLNQLQGKTNAPQFDGPTFDASVNRADSGGASNLVQFDAISARHRA